MVVLRTPKGWTGPAEVDGLPVEGTFRSHQVPLADLAAKPEHLVQLEQWLLSYRPVELFDEDGAPREQLGALLPRATVAWVPTLTRTAACSCAISSCPTFVTTRSR
jgi:xylulose-5-phosphate/fructose-6-phosphate phosphoketolase